MHVLVMSLEIGGASEVVLLSVAGERIAAWVTALHGLPVWVGDLKVGKGNDGTYLGSSK